MQKIIFLFSLFITTICFGQTDILLTDFQTGMPVAYTIVDNDSLTPAAQVSEYTSAWITVQDPENSLDTVASSTSFFDPIGTANRWLITSPVVLGAFGNLIEWEAKSHDASFPDDYLVLVSTTDSLITSFTDTIGYVMEENAEWTVRSVNLSNEGYDNQTIYVAFVNVTENGFILYVDDIRVWKEDPVSISENESTISLNVYPNPTKGELTVSCSEEIEKMTLFSSNGQLLLQSKEPKMNIESYPNGVYFLHIKTAQSVKTIKVLKQ